MSTLSASHCQMIKHRQIAARLNPKRSGFAKDPFFIVPRPPLLQWPLLAAALKEGAASVDLRLGTWFLAMRQATTPLLEASEPSQLSRRLRSAADALKLTQQVHKELKELLVL